jgi:hypothetical protein
LKLVACVDPRVGTDDDGYLIFPPLYGDLTRTPTLPFPAAQCTTHGSGSDRSDSAAIVAAARSAAGGRGGTGVGCTRSEMVPLFKRMLEAVAHCHHLGIAVHAIAPASFGWSDEGCTQVVLSGLGQVEVVCGRGEQLRLRAAAAAAALEHPSEAELLGAHVGGGGAARLAAAAEMAAFHQTAAATEFARDIVGLAEVFHFLLRQDSPSAAGEPVPTWALALLRRMLETNPARQLTAAELADADWFQWEAEAEAEAEAAAAALHAHAVATALFAARASGRGTQSEGRRRRRATTSSLTSQGHAAALDELAVLVAGNGGGGLTAVLDEVDLESGDDDQSVPTWKERSAPAVATAATASTTTAATTATAATPSAAITINAATATATATTTAAAAVGATATATAAVAASGDCADGGIVFSATAPPRPPSVSSCKTTHSARYPRSRNQSLKRSRSRSHSRSHDEETVEHTHAVQRARLDCA